MALEFEELQNQNGPLIETIEALNLRRKELLAQALHKEIQNRIEVASRSPSPALGKIGLQLMALKLLLATANPLHLYDFLLVLDRHYHECIDIAESTANMR